MNELMINRHDAKDAKEKEDREHLRPLGEERRGFLISLASAANFISPLGVLGVLAVHPHLKIADKRDKRDTASP